MSKIQWTEKTWNPVTGCDKVSQGCKNCYAETLAKSKLLNHLPEYKDGFLGNVLFHPNRLEIPMRTMKPTMFFVNSMSDLFHEKITNEQIAAIFGVMAACPQHVFQILTKRPERALEWFRWMDSPIAGLLIQEGLKRPWANEYTGRGTRAYMRGVKYACDNLRDYTLIVKQFLYKGAVWTLPNVWMGVSVENEKTAGGRIPLLNQIPAAVKFISIEPLLEGIHLNYEFFSNVKLIDVADWVIIGGESGTNARECKVEWIESIVDQCKAANVPVFVKQLGSYLAKQMGLKDKKGGDINEFPEHLRIREYPQTMNHKEF